MTDIKLPLDLPVSARMGLQGLIASALIDSGDTGIPWEVAIQQPGYLPSGNRWAVIEHFDTDPDNDTKGSSGVFNCDTLDEALVAFRHLLAQADRKIPGYLVAGRDADGRQVFVDVDEFSSGLPYFTDSRELAKWYPSVTAANRALATVPNIHAAGQKLDMTSFGILPATYLTRQIAVGAVNGAAPTGWRYVVSKPDGSAFKMPERHWKGYGTIGEASPHQDLAQAMAACAEGEFPILVSRRLGDQVLAAAVVDRLIADEEYALSGEPEVNLIPGVPFAPK